MEIWSCRISPYLLGDMELQGISVSPFLLVGLPCQPYMWVSLIYWLFFIRVGSCRSRSGSGCDKPPIKHYFICTITVPWPLLNAILINLTKLFLMKPLYINNVRGLALSPLFCSFIAWFNYSWCDGSYCCTALYSHD